MATDREKTYGKWADYIKRNPDLEEWALTVEPATAKSYAQRLHAFEIWMNSQEEFQGMSLNDLLDYQEKAVGRKRTRLASKIAQFVSEDLGERQKLRPRSMTHYFISIRYFFEFHGYPLSKRRFSIPEESLPPVEQKLTRDDLVKILNRADLRNKTIYTCAFQAGMGYREFNLFNGCYHEQIKPQFEAYAERLIITLTPRKMNKRTGLNYFTIIGTDGTKLLKEYIRKTGEPEIGEAVFKPLKTNKQSDGFLKSRTYRKNFNTLCRQVGLIYEKGTERSTRYGYSPHQLRDVFRTEFQATDADHLLAEFMMGHKVDPNEYLQFTKQQEYALKEYEKAESRLNIISRPDLDVVSKDEVVALRQEFRKMQEQFDDYKQLAKDDPELVTNPDFTDQDPEDIPDEWKRK